MHKVVNAYGFRMLVAVAAMLVIASCSDRRRNEREIRRVFRMFNESNTAYKGEESVKLIDSESVRYFSDELELIRHADSATIEGLRFGQKVTVLGVRHIATADEIGKMDGRSLFIYMVKNGMLGSHHNNVPMRLKVLSVGHRVATVRTIDSFTSDGVIFEFHKEYGEWKLDLPTNYERYADIWNGVIKSSGKTEHEFLLWLLTEMNGVPPDNSIWHPVM